MDTGSSFSKPVIEEAPLKKLQVRRRFRVLGKQAPANERSNSPLSCNLTGQAAVVPAEVRLHPPQPPSPVLPGPPSIDIRPQCIKQWLATDALSAVPQASPSRLSAHDWKGGQTHQRAHPLCHGSSGHGADGQARMPMNIMGPCDLRLH